MNTMLEVCPQLDTAPLALVQGAANRRRAGAWPRIRAEFDLHLSAARFVSALTSATPAADIEAATHALRAGIRMAARLIV